MFCTVVYGEAHTICTQLVTTYIMIDCIIIGGGLAGLTTAYALLKKNYRVSIFEQHAHGGSASWAAGGILSPMHPWHYPDEVVALARRGAEIYPSLTEELLAATKINPEWYPCGLLTLSPAPLPSITQWADRTGTIIEICPPAQSQIHEPNIQPKKTVSILMPTVASIRTPRLLKALSQYLIHQGVTIHEQTPVTELITENQTIRGIHTAKDTWHAHQVVIATGAWSGLPLSNLPSTPPIEPVCGQIIHLDAEPGLISTIILDGNRYLIPRKNGSILVGSTAEYTGFKAQTTAEAREDLYQFAIKTIPALSNCRIINHWAGLRPGSADSIPYICEHPALKNIYFNTGHFRNGIVSAPASAELLAELMTVGQHRNADPFQFDRG